jgi:uncharacterized protein
MTTTRSPAPARPRPLTRTEAAAEALIVRANKVRGHTVERDLRIPMRDGAELLADRWSPAGTPLGTVLIRSPYPAIVSSLEAASFVAAGYQVVAARCRGAFGSGGTFEPMVNEVADGADTVAWLRAQPWFGGRFATAGGSYLGFTQWALLMDPPPELAAAIIQVGPHDFSRSAYNGGAFSLNDFLGWSDQVSHQEDFGLVRTVLQIATAVRRQAPAMAKLPLVEAAAELTGGRADWYPDWVGRRDLTDPFWSTMQLGAALDRVQVPVLLHTGWQDLFLQQTLEQYAHLHRRGVDVALTIGPWTHTGGGRAGARIFGRESREWLAEHLAGTGTRMRWQPVRVNVTGVDEWRDLPEWPPASAEHVLFPQPGGALGAQPAPVGAAPVAFTYDPTDPTPTIGGRLLALNGGYRDDSALAKRADVLAFTGAPLATALEIVGTPVVELAHTSDNPHADLFVRISEVDPKGRSRNVSEGFVRLDPRRPGGTVQLTLDACAHRFSAGNRIRLLVSGGSFPRWERNLGTDDDPATGTRLAPSRRRVDLIASRLVLPVKA